MPNETLREAARQMARSLEALGREFSAVRTGKASPAILDAVRVEAYGSTMPLNQLSNITAPEPQLLLIQPYDPQMASAVAKAVQSSDLGLNPSVDGNLIRVAIPPLTEERRRELVKVLHRLAEEVRVAVRHARHQARSTLQKRQKEGEFGEDDLHKQFEDLQKLTDDHIGRVDELLAKKEAEVMEV